MKVIKDGRILYNNKKLIEADIGIKNGRIKKIKKTGLKGEEIDAKGCIVLPSGVDIHAHFRDFKEKQKETWKTGTKSAAAGGITTAVDQPNTKPPTKTTEALRKKIKKAQKNSYIDFGINGAATPDSDLIGLARNKITAFGEAFFPQTKKLGITEEETKEILEVIKKLKKHLFIHAEDQEIINKSKKTINPDKPTEYPNHRPKKAEIEAVKKAIKINDGTKIHFCHITTGKAAEIISKTNYTSEITLHHLFFTKKDLKKKRTYIKTNPPIRDKKTRKKLWKHFKESNIPILASDHAPHTTSEKEREFNKAPSGVPGIETMYPIMNYQVKRKNLSLIRLIKAISEYPSKLLDQNKGIIKEGKDADLALFDFNQINKIKPRELHSKCGWSPYKGKKAIFPKKTLLRGKIIYKNKQFYEPIGEMIEME